MSIEEEIVKMTKQIGAFKTGLEMIVGNIENQLKTMEKQTEKLIEQTHFMPKMRKETKAFSKKMVLVESLMTEVLLRLNTISNDLLI